jgi:hypothetical protein
VIELPVEGTQAPRRAPCEPEASATSTTTFAGHTHAKVDSRIKVGFWGLWNIAGEPPTQEESGDLAPAIGVYLDRVVSELAMS